jgi:uncharacterized protein (DUF1778 family)
VLCCRYGYDTEARLAADDAQLDRTLFSVNPKAYAEFLDRLDAPPQPNERLRRTTQAAARGTSGERLAAQRRHH